MLLDGCHNDEELLKKRCLTIQEGLAPGQVCSHRGGLPTINLESGAAGTARRCYGNS